MIKVLHASFANFALAALVCAAGAMGGASQASVSKVTTVVAPPVNGKFDIQLGGAYKPAAGVTIVERDRTAAPVEGKYNLCYLNAFQTQDDEAAFWNNKHYDLLLKDANQQPISDPNWPGEYILDTSTSLTRGEIAAIEYTWIDDCAAAGYQGIDPDNLDSWTRSGGQLTQQDNLALATLLATRAHADGLAIGQKNASELGSTGKTTAGFDFAVTESCQQYHECGAYTSVYGRHVLEIEYTSARRSIYTAACKARGATISIVLRDPDLVAKGQSGYHYESC